jgi:hypothetical protein
MKSGFKISKVLYFFKYKNPLFERKYIAINEQNKIDEIKQNLEIVSKRLFNIEFRTQKRSNRLNTFGAILTQNTGKIYNKNIIIDKNVEILRKKSKLFNIISKNIVLKILLKIE